jgi:hypothetical protein
VTNGASRAADLGGELLIRAHSAATRISVMDNLFNTNRRFSTLLIGDRTACHEIADHTHIPLISGKTVKSAGSGLSNMKLLKFRSSVQADTATD